MGLRMVISDPLITQEIMVFATSKGGVSKAPSDLGSANPALKPTLSAEFKVSTRGLNS